MDLQTERDDQQSWLSPSSLIATIGFSLYTIWVVYLCFWVVGFPETPEGIVVPTLERLAAFLGMPIGYIALGFLGKRAAFNVFDRRVLIPAAAIAALLPLVCAVLLSASSVTTGVVIACLFLASVAGAFIQTCWLDVFSRFDLTKVGLSLGLSVTIGAVASLLFACLPWAVQGIMAGASVLGSAGMVVYSTRIAPHNEERAPLESVQKKWDFTREIEPSLFLLGVIFALSFFFLLGHDPMWVLAATASIAVGALILIAADLSKHVFSITSVQRIVTVVAVAACLLMSFENKELRLALSIFMAAACSFLVIANSVFLVRKICSPRSVPVFRMIPKRIAIFALGFVGGWIIAAAVLVIPDVSLGIISYIRLGAAIALVAVTMAFLPVEKHHDDTASAAAGSRAYAVADTQGAPAHQAGTAGAQAPASGIPSTRDAAGTYSPHGGAGVGSTASSLVPPPAVPAGTAAPSESAAFDAKCTSIARLYQLSPREAEILPYLARGRNNAYLQEKFVISPHTAKSHIYNIYRKLDIHSQQKLMDFVEDFPADYDTRA